TIVNEILQRYEDEKKRRGLVDYDDLIDKTLELLGNVDAAWVHYKLDFGIDHLLIDEAQDTSSSHGRSAAVLPPNLPLAPARAAPGAPCSRWEMKNNRSIRFRTRRPRNLPKCAVTSSARIKPASPPSLHANSPIPSARAPTSSPRS